MELKLTNVRGAFLDLFVARAYKDNPDKKYGGQFILAKNDPQIKKIEAVIKAVAKEEFGEKYETILKTIRNNAMKYFFRDGDSKLNAAGDIYEGFADSMYVAAKNKSRPILLDRDKTPLTEKDGKPYAGCFVNVILDVYALPANKNGPAVHAALKGVQFAKDGDSFSGSAPASVDSFDDLSEGADAGGLA